MKLGGLICKWLEWLAHIKRVSPHTIAAYESDLSYFIEFQKKHLKTTIVTEDLLNLTTRDFRAWLNYRVSKNYDPKSTSRALSVIRSFYRYLNKHDYPNNKWISYIRSPRIRKTLPRPLSINQAKNLITEIGVQTDTKWVGLRDRAIFTLLYGCGLRLGEALQLKRKEAPLKSDTLLIKGKGNKERLVPVLPFVSQTLIDYLKACPYIFMPNDPLFVGEKGGKLQPSIVQKNLRTYRKAVGLPDNATPHSLRHSCATHLLNKTGDLRSIQELLGHASILTTQIYTDVTTDRLLNIYNRAHPRGAAHKDKSKDHRSIKCECCSRFISFYDLEGGVLKGKIYCNDNGDVDNWTCIQCVG